MKTMPKSTKEEKYRWIKPILEDGITIKNMVNVCPFSERSLKYWLADYRKRGINGLENKSTRPKSNPKETPIRIKEKIIELRKKTRKCALKLKWSLEKQGINIHHRTIGKILKRENLVRKYKIRRVKYKYVKAPLSPGELIEIDVKYVPKRLNNKRYFQYTSIDCATRWRYLKVYREQSNSYAIEFLEETIKRFKYKIRAVKTDNHSTFTNRYIGYKKSADPLNPRLHSFDIFCQKNNIIHYLIDPGKPQQNAFVERSHRSDQEAFYDIIRFRNEKELKYELKLWNIRYNNLEHCGLDGRTPNEALRLFRVQNVRA
ncbi:MAG TPA: transposase [Candidatus Wolfebacteria bacterium]|nr:transposase [Candidatus Wolfebacteria bacterium]